jgi:hypothetical protein
MADAKQWAFYDSNGFKVDVWGPNEGAMSNTVYLTCGGSRVSATMLVSRADWNAMVEGVAAKFAALDAAKVVPS